MKPPQWRTEFWLGLLALLFCGFVVWFPVTDSDIWWHCAAGREIVARGAFLSSDPFSYTAQGLSWFDLHWIFQVCMYGAVMVAGTAGLVVVKCLLFVSACAILFFAIPGRRSWFFGAAVFCLLMYGVRYQVTERPVIFSLVFLALNVFVLERGLDRGRYRVLAVLIPLQIVWVNCQGLFGLGIALFAIYFAGNTIDAVAGLGNAEGKNHRPSPMDLGLLAHVAVGLLIACLVNPYGWRSLVFALKLFGAIEPASGNLYSTAIAENIPLLGLLGTAQQHYFWITLFVALLTLLSFVMAGRRMRSAHALMFAAFAVLAFMANRNVLLFVFVAAPILVYNLSHAPVFDRLAVWLTVPRPRRAIVAALRGVVVLILGLYALSHALMLAQGPQQGSLAPFRFPLKSAEYLKSHEVPGRLFNTDRYGGFLLWKLYPSTGVFIDGRFTLRGAGFLRDYCDLLADPASLFASVKNRYGITQACVQTSIFPIYNGLAAYLYHDPRWRLVVADGSEALFVVDSLAKTPRVDLGSIESVVARVSSLRAQWSGSPALFRESLVHFASFLQTIGEQTSADRVRGILRQEAVGG